MGRAICGSCGGKRGANGDQSLTGSLLPVSRKIVAKVTEQKLAHEKEYSIYQKLLAANGKRILFSEMMGYLEKIKVDTNKKIEVKWNIPHGSFT